jgi:transglutaminase superfamily protein
MPKSVWILVAFVALSIAARPAAAQFKDKAPAKGGQLGPAVTSKLKVGVLIKARSNLQNALATVPVPVDWPEQTVHIAEEELSPTAASVSYRVSSMTLKQMVVAIPLLPAGQEARAVVTLEISRSPQKAPADTTIYSIPKKLERGLMSYLGPSPQIEPRHVKITAQLKQIVSADQSAWQQIEAIYDWVRTNIKANADEERKGAARTLIDKDGHAEDMTSLFIAFCRAHKVPARTVWLQTSVYPEFYLVDDDGHGHWFPCQIEGGRNFGGIEDVSPILQKGDNFHDAERPKDKMRRVPEYFTVPLLRGASSPEIHWIRDLLPG